MRWYCRADALLDDDLSDFPSLDDSRLKQPSSRGFSIGRQPQTTAISSSMIVQTVSLAFDATTYCEKLGRGSGVSGVKLTGYVRGKEVLKLDQAEEAKDTDTRREGVLLAPK